MFKIGPKVEEITPSKFNVIDENFVEMLKKYLGKDIFRQVYEITETKKIMEGRTNYQMKRVYTDSKNILDVVNIWLTLSESTTPKLVQFDFYKNVIVSDRIKKDIKNGKFWRRIQEILDKYSKGNL